MGSLGFLIPRKFILIPHKKIASIVKLARGGDRVKLPQDFPGFFRVNLLDSVNGLQVLCKRFPDSISYERTAQTRTPST